MKSLLKKLVPLPVWEAVRHVYSYLRRLILDIRDTASPLSPLEWIESFVLARTVRPRYSMVPAARLRLLYDLSKRITREGVRGDIVECGVYNGGSAAIMAAAQSGSKDARTVWLFDSFEGLPPPTEQDGTYEREHYYKGWCGGTAEKVEEIFQRFRLPRERLRIVQGWFENTFPKTVPNMGPIALLHIDADWYESVKICLETLYPKVVSGGYIELDDY